MYNKSSVSHFRACSNRWSVTACVRTGVGWHLNDRLKVNSPTNFFFPTWVQPTWVHSRSNANEFIRKRKERKGADISVKGGTVWMPLQKLWTGRRREARRLDTRNLWLSIRTVTTPVHYFKNCDHRLDESRLHNPGRAPKRCPYRLGHLRDLTL